MSFFEKESTEKNLQYDDVAFLHFGLTISIVFTVIFGYVVIQKLKPRIKNYESLKKLGIFKKQLENELQKRNRETYNIWFYILLIMFLGSAVASLGLFYINSQQETQMIGFDPHEILGLDSSAETRQIRKAYRKLALIWHPDRNKENPQAQAKFIMISKAYECLTDEAAIENCKKYGNPDGQSSFQVGIGLPKFIISKENTTVILPIMLGCLLIILPMLFMRWNSRIRTKDINGFDMRNYAELHQFFTQNFSATTGFYLLTVLMELQSDKKLKPQEKEQFFKFLQEKKIIDFTYVSTKMSEGQIYLLHELLRHMALKIVTKEISETVPPMLDQLFRLSCAYAKKINDKKFLDNEGKLPIRWIGTKHLLMLLEFTRTFYNCSLFAPPGRTPFDFLDLTEQDAKISMNNPLKNGLREISRSEESLKQHVALFPETHREYIQKQVKDLPLLSLDIKCTVGNEEVKQITVDDYAMISFRIKKENLTSGFCALKGYSFMKKERFYLLLVYEGNLLYWKEVTFPDGKQQFVCKYPYRQSVVKNMNFVALIYSDCHYGLDVRQNFSLKVVDSRASEESEIEFHEEDINIERQSKSFFEKILALQTETPSDLELSDTEDEEKEKTEEKEKVSNGRPKSRMVEEKDEDRDREDKKQK